MEDFPGDQPDNLRKYDFDETKESTDHMSLREGDGMSQRESSLDYKNLVSKLEQELINKDKNILDGVVNSEQSRRDPEEEFFMLAVLALKMCHNEQYSDAEYLYEISANKLLSSVRNLQLPFHKWYGWIETRF